MKDTTFERVKGVSIEDEQQDVFASTSLGNMVHSDEKATFALLPTSNHVLLITGTDIIIVGGATPGISL